MTQEAFDWIKLALLVIAAVGLFLNLYNMARSREKEIDAKVKAGDDQLWEAVNAVNNRLSNGISEDTATNTSSIEDIERRVGRLERQRDRETQH